MNDAEHEAFVSSVTPIESTDGVDSYRNTVGMACACGDPFDDAVILTRRPQGSPRSVSSTSPSGRSVTASE